MPVKLYHLHTLSHPRLLWWLWKSHRDRPHTFWLQKKAGSDPGGMTHRSPTHFESDYRAYTALKIYAYHHVTSQMKQKKNPIYKKITFKSEHKKTDVFLLMCMFCTFALSDAAGVQVGCGGSFRTGLTLQLTLLVLVGTQPATLTLIIFKRKVGSHWTLDWKSIHS